jgi:hypothetical protein
MLDPAAALGFAAPMDVSGVHIVVEQPGDLARRGQIRWPRASSLIECPYGNIHTTNVPTGEICGDERGLIARSVAFIVREIGFDHPIIVIELHPAPTRQGPGRDPGPGKRMTFLPREAALSRSLGSLRPCRLCSR